jgi:deazaflavin-dependent oxidoreductase (nitroreductase family)
MSNSRAGSTSPTGLSRLLWRAPIWLYRLGLGGLLGSHFVLLNHVGRKSGQPRQTVLEVVDRDEETGAIMIASGFGKGSDWYRNILKQPDVTIQLGRKKIAVTAVLLTPAASGQAMVDYAHRNPRAAKQLMRLVGYNVEGSDDEYFELGRDQVPFITLYPHHSGE